MDRRIAWLVWLALIGLWVFTAPPMREDVGPWVMDLATGNWAGEEPWVAVLFNLMGVWPMLLLVLFADQLRSRPVPGLPFVLGTFVLGAFALLPWLGLRSDPDASDPWGHRIAHGRIGGVVAAVMGLVATALIGHGLLYGDLAAFEAVRTADAFVYVMTFDFAALWAVSVLETRHRGGPWALTLVPGAGLAAWCLWLAARGIEAS